METTKGSTNSKTTETAFSDWGIDYSLVTEAIQQALGDFVCTIVLGDLFTENEDLRVGLKLLSESLIEGISDSVLLDP